MWAEKKTNILNEIKSLNTKQQWFKLRCCFTRIPRQNVLQLSSTWGMKAQSLGVMLCYQVKSRWSRGGDFSVLLLVCLFGIFCCFIFCLFLDHAFPWHSPHSGGRAAAWAGRAGEGLGCYTDYGNSGLMQFPPQKLQALHDSQRYPRQEISGSFSVQSLREGREMNSCPDQGIANKTYNLCLFI